MYASFTYATTLFLGLSALAGIPCQGQEHPQDGISRSVWVMGTQARIDLVAADRQAALAASESVIRALDAAEAELSTWRDDSDLSRLNRAPTHDTRSPRPELARLLAEVARWSDRTRGAFHPAVGPAIDAWGLRGAGRVPTPAELGDALAAVGDHGVLVDRDGGEVTRLHPRAWIDAGAFGKGAALRAVADSLRAHGVRAASVDLGGQLLVLGDRATPVRVAHPAERDRPTVTVRVREASIATSGQSERAGHIIDPRTARPVSAWGSVTVVADDPLVADVLSTALFVLGPSEGLELAEGLDGVGVLFLSNDDGALQSSMNQYMADLVALASASAHEPPIFR